MALGGCFCGQIRMEYNSPPPTSALCHCTDCRKLTGSPYTYNFVVKTTDLKIFGSPKGVAKTSDSRNAIKNFFCSDCGTSLFGHKVKSDGQPEETTIIRAGIFDDINFLNEMKPQLEIYTERRLEWLSPIEGVTQVVGMFEGS
ncbi:hypothetical protein VTL71DRAFT_15550 [Oculimacula yallundae]|uniref:CENP-V/GFA domain-containing protein n=1 Tax=Oculimacula yallundae TaxID=86028 RepID=A0ABR4CIA0_9HELO